MPLARSRSPPRRTSSTTSSRTSPAPASGARSVARASGSTSRARWARGSRATTGAGSPGGRPPRRCSTADRPKRFGFATLFQDGKPSTKWTYEMTASGDGTSAHGVVRLDRRPDVHQADRAVLHPQPPGAAREGDRRDPRQDQGHRRADDLSDRRSAGGDGAAAVGGLGLLEELRIALVLREQPASRRTRCTAAIRTSVGGRTRRARRCGGPGARTGSRRRWRSADRPRWLSDVDQLLLPVGVGDVEVGAGEHRRLGVVDHSEPLDRDGRRGLAGARRSPRSRVGALATCLRCSRMSRRMRRSSCLAKRSRSVVRAGPLRPPWRKNTIPRRKGVCSRPLRSR